MLRNEPFVNEKSTLSLKFSTKKQLKEKWSSAASGATRTSQNLGCQKKKCQLSLSRNFEKNQILTKTSNTKLLNFSMSKKGKVTKYLVRWTGFNSDNDSWEPAANLPKNKIAAFNKKQKNADSSDEEEKSDDEDREYAVEKIIMRKGVGKRRLYRIRWAGFSDAHNSWEPEENLGGAKKLVREFNKNADEREAKQMEKEYEVEKIVDEKTHYSKPLYCVKWHGYKKNHNTWQDAESLADCQDVLEKWELTKEKRAEKKQEQTAKRDKKKAEERKKREEAKLSKAAENAAKKATTA